MKYIYILIYFYFILLLCSQNALQVPIPNMLFIL
jgi:hypothetical protein